MPRVKGKPKQKDTTLPTVFENEDPPPPPAIENAAQENQTVEGQSTESLSNGNQSQVIADSVQAFDMISKAMEKGNFTILPIFDSTTNQIVPPLGFDKLAPPAFFLPEKIRNQPARDKDREMVNCTICDKTMKRGSLREHMDRHKNTGKFFCDLCGKNFSRASAREKHIRTHTGERPFRCHICPKAYRQKVHLNEHLRSHSGERPFVCRLCGFSLASKSLLNRHLRTHGVQNGANDAPGTWLRTDAPKSQVLAAAEAVGRSIDTVAVDNPETIHITALNAVATAAAIGRKHLCPECPAGFPTMQALRSHRTTTHGMVPEHTCDSCGEIFTSRKTLKAHMRSSHPQICPLCNEVMPQRRRWVLEVHIRESHPGVSAEAVLGPSPLSIGAAAAFQKRALCRKQKEAERLLKLAPLTPLFMDTVTPALDKSESEQPQTENESEQASQGPYNTSACDEEMEEDESSQSSLIETLKKLEKRSQEGNHPTNHC
ncbi:unnamed protein product [Rodentolepis nana]|uniref:Zinc finger protein n=1 Tax=Rodentolepis nana TaxID=102285 RepID=A0A0R3T948_RODNA|nr:unnamed protein product [Rodentolepis nana]